MVDNSFDLRLFKAKNHIDDALGVAKRGQQPMPQGQMPMPQGQMPAPQGQFNVKPQGQMPQGQTPMPQGQMPMPQGQMPAPPRPFKTGGLAVKKGHQEGGLATSLTGAKETRDADVDFLNTRNLHLRDVAGLARAKGGGAWTRKEGKNPEGGLNAKGRASLKAQGHDIKPPVSAKQAKKSPKAAARRKSFCARSAGQAKMFPNAARDPESRLNKARRKWDC